MKSPAPNCAGLKSGLFSSFLRGAIRLKSPRQFVNAPTVHAAPAQVNSLHLSGTQECAKLGRITWTLADNVANNKKFSPGFFFDHFAKGEKNERKISYTTESRKALH